MRLAIAVLTIAAAAAAQTVVTLPFPEPPVTTPPTPPVANIGQPFASGIGRYQQWFSAAQAGNFGGQPIRLDRVEIEAGQAATLTTVLDMQVAIGLASTGITSQFDANFTSSPLVVVPRQNVTMVPAAAGGSVLTLPFASPFTWDGQNAFVIEFRIWGNSRANAAFNFDLRGMTNTFGSVVSIYQGGSATATTSSNSPTPQGLFMRFRTHSGATVAFGAGCRGINFVQPTCSVLSLAQPGSVWVHRLDNAAGQRNAGLALGFSRTQWGSFALPLDLEPILGAFGCALLVSPDFEYWTTTVGGQGTATASIQVSIPPLPQLAGWTVFSQWVVLDPASPNGLMAATAGLWSIVTPVGG